MFHPAEYHFLHSSSYSVIIVMITEIKHLSHLACHSHMINRNPEMNPCGTPQVMVIYFEADPAIATTLYCFLPIK